MTKEFLTKSPHYRDEVNLILAIFNQAIEDGDLEYFNKNNKSLQFYLDVIGLDMNRFLILFNKKYGDKK